MINLKPNAGIDALRAVLMDKDTKQLIRRFYEWQHERYLACYPDDQSSRPGMSHDVRIALEEAYGKDQQQIKDETGASDVVPLRETFETQILRRLGKPSILTTDDLWTAFQSTMRLGADHFDLTYDLFAGNVIEIQLHGRTPPFFVCDSPVNKNETSFIAPMTRENYDEPTESDDVEEVDTPEFQSCDPSELGVDSDGTEGDEEISTADLSDVDRIIWQRNGLMLFIKDEPTGKLTAPGDTTSPVWAQIEGSASQDALDIIRRDIQRVLPTVMHSITSAVSPNVVRFGAHAHQPKSPLFATLTIPQIIPHRTIIATALDAYFDGDDPEIRDDPMARRIRLAIQLLVEADSQRQDALNLALAVTALECLVGTRKNSTRSFRENIALLLETESAYQKIAQEFADGVYDDRSRVLHGGSLDIDEPRSLKVRFLAARVLAQVVEYREYYRRLEEYDTMKSHDKFMENFRDKRRPETGAKDPDPAVELWRTVNHEGFERESEEVTRS